MEKKLKVTKFANLVGVMPATIYRHVEKGIIRYDKAKIGGREIILIPISEQIKYRIEK